MMKTVIILFGLINTVVTVPLGEFFPYGTGVNDTIFPVNDDESTNALYLPRIFPYFDNNHRQIYLANNGLFSFLGSIWQYVPDSFPLNDSRRLIAGFWSDIDTRGNISGGNLVYYQIYSSDRNGVFEKASRYVQEYFPSESSFTPTMVITGTWYRVGAFYTQTRLTNTFQIVLATDEIRSFAYLLYHDLQWASPQSAYLNNSNNINETGGQAGFNAGDGVIYEMLPYSRTSSVRRLVNTSNVNVPGLFAYRIDTETINLGGCGNTSQFLYRPRRGSQLGLTPLTIQGPCFTNLTEHDVKCRFGESIVVDAIIINQFQAICLTPFVSLPEFINIYLSINGGLTYEIFPYIFSYTPVQYGLSSLDNSEVILINHTDMIINVNQQITLGWTLSERTVNTWPNDTIRLQIEIVSVQLNETNGGIIQGNSTIIETDIIPVVGFQIKSITVPSINNNFQTIYFRIIGRHILTNQTYIGLNSGLFVLYDNQTETSNYCEAWLTNQPLPSTWNQNLYPCPLTLAQARVARCCYQFDPLCNENNLNSSSSSNCNLHNGRSDHNELSAVACYLSRTTNQWNAGSECCYDSTGQLITRGTGAGTDDRYHASLYPIQHFYSDTLPYLACCLLNSDEESCQRYFNFRPIRQGSNSPTANGGTWGDPHYTTLDGLTYTFNGYGEYTYLAITNSSTSLNTPYNPSTQTILFNSQIRTTPLNSSSNSATVIHGFAAKSNDPLAEAISIIVSRREMLIIRRGNQTIDLDTTNDDNIISTNNSLIIYYPEMTLEKNRTSEVLTLSWFIGISIQITPIAITNGLILNIGISISGLYQNCTYGLLGLYDNNPNNDFRLPNGTIIDTPNTLTLQQIHQQFGQKWAINPNNSLFYYESGDSASIYENKNQIYTPSFQNPNPSSSSQLNTTLAVCNIDPTSTNQSAWTIAQQTCYYDMSVTNDASLGQSSRIAANDIIQTTIDQRYPPEFDSQIPLTVTINESTPINIDFTATSEYSTTIIYTLIQGPASAIFNPSTAIFRWENPSINDDNTIVRVSAQDTTYNLLSTRELTIRVIEDTAANSTTTNSPSTTTTSDATYIISIKSIFIITMNIIGTFYFY